MRRFPIAPRQSPPNPPLRRQRWWARGLAAGCIWFAGLAFGRTQRVATIANITPNAVRLLGVRDLLSAAALIATRDPRAAIAARVVCDGSDVVTFARRRPWLACVAAIYGALGVVALRAGSARSRPADR